MENNEEVSWMLKFINSDGFVFTTSILEVVSYIVSIIGIIAVAFTVIQYVYSKQQHDYDIKFKKNEMAVELLNKFAQEIIPSINVLEESLRLEFEGFGKSKVIPEKLKEIKIHIKIDKGIIDIFNSLEQVSVYIKTDIVNTDILFDPISNVLCNFVERHNDVFSDLLIRSPYSNLTYVVETWSSEKQLKIIEKQETMLRIKKDKIKKKNLE